MVDTFFVALGRQMDNKRSSIYPGPWSKAKVAISICFHGIAMISNVQNGLLKSEWAFGRKVSCTPLKTPLCAPEGVLSGSVDFVDPLGSHLFILSGKETIRQEARPIPHLIWQGTQRGQNRQSGDGQLILIS